MSKWNKSITILSEYDFTRKKFILLALLLIVYFVFTRIKPTSLPQNSSSQKTEISATVSVNKNNLVRTYYGLLPCDNCEGRETTLILSVNKEVDGGTYKLVEKYIGRGNASMEYQGNWAASEGLTEDPNAEIIVIDPDNPETRKGFLIVGNDQIEELDELGNRYAIGSKYRLKLQK